VSRTLHSPASFRYSTCVSVVCFPGITTLSCCCSVFLHRKTENDVGGERLRDTEQVQFKQLLVLDFRRGEWEVAEHLRGGCNCLVRELWDGGPAIGAGVSSGVSPMRDLWMGTDHRIRQGETANFHAREARWHLFLTIHDTISTSNTAYQYPAHSSKSPI